MLVIEAKLKGSQNQYKVLDEMILTGQFIRNSCLRYWIDNKDVKRNDLQKLCSQLAKDANFPWVKKLNSQARQASADRAWQSIQRFYKNCRLNKPGKKAVRPRDDESRKRSDPAPPTARLRNADQERERAPREVIQNSKNSLVQ